MPSYDNMEDEKDLVPRQSMKHQQTQNPYPAYDDDNSILDLTATTTGANTTVNTSAMAGSGTTLTSTIKPKKRRFAKSLKKMVNRVLPTKTNTNHHGPSTTTPNFVIKSPTASNNNNNNSSSMMTPFDEPPLRNSSYRTASSTKGGFRTSRRSRTPATAPMYEEYFGDDDDGGASINSADNGSVTSRSDSIAMNTNFHHDSPIRKTLFSDPPSVYHQLDFTSTDDPNHQSLQSVVVGGSVEEEESQQDSMDEGDYTMAVVGLAREFEKHDSERKKEATDSLEQPHHAYTPSKPIRPQQQQHLTIREDAMVSVEEETEEEPLRQHVPRQQDNNTEALEFALEQHEMQLLRQSEDIQDQKEMMQPEASSLGRRQGHQTAPRPVTVDQNDAPVDYRGYLLANTNTNRYNHNDKSIIDSQDGPVAFSLDELASLGSGASSPQDTKQEDVLNVPVYMSPGRNSQSAVDHLRQELSHTLEGEPEAFQNISDPGGQSQSEEDSTATVDPNVVAKVPDGSSAAGDPSLLLISSSSDGSSPSYELDAKTSQNSSIKNMTGERVMKTEPTQLLDVRKHSATEGNSGETSQKSSVCGITESETGGNVKAEAESKVIGKKEANKEVSILAAFRARVFSHESADNSVSPSANNHKELSVDNYGSFPAKNQVEKSLVNDAEAAASFTGLSATKSIVSAASLEEDESICQEIDGLSIAATKGGYATDTGYATDAAVDTVTHDGYNTEGGTVSSSVMGGKDAPTIDTSVAVVLPTTKFSRAAARGRRRGRRRQIRNEQQKKIDTIRHGVNTSHDNSISTTGTPHHISRDAEVEANGETTTESCIKAVSKTPLSSSSRRPISHPKPADDYSDTSVTSRNTVSKMRQMFERGASPEPSNPGTPKSKASASDIRKMRYRAKSHVARCQSPPSGATNVVDSLTSKQAKTVPSPSEGKSFDLSSSAKKEAAKTVHVCPTVLPTKEAIHNGDFKNAANHIESDTTGSSDNDTLARLSGTLEASATAHLQENRNTSVFKAVEGPNKERPTVTPKTFGAMTPTKGTPTRVSGISPNKCRALSKDSTPTKGDSLWMSTSASLGDRSFFAVHEDTSLFGTFFSAPVTPSPQRPQGERSDEQLQLSPSGVNHNLSPCKKTTNTKIGSSQHRSKKPDTSTQQPQTEASRTVSTIEASKLDNFFLKSKIGKEESSPAQVYHPQEEVGDFVSNGSLASKEQGSFLMSVGPDFACEISEILEESSKAGSSRDRIEYSEDTSPNKLLAGVSDESLPSSFSKLFESSNSTNTEEIEKNGASGSQNQVAPPSMAGSSQNQEDEKEENETAAPGEQSIEAAEAANLPAEDQEMLAKIDKVQENFTLCVKAEGTSQAELANAAKDQSEEDAGFSLATPSVLEEQEPSKDSAKAYKLSSGKDVDDDTDFDDMMDQLENSAVAETENLERTHSDFSRERQLDEFFANDEIFGDHNDFDGDLCSATADQALEHSVVPVQGEETKTIADVPSLDWDEVLDELLTDIIFDDTAHHEIIADGPPYTLLLKETSSSADDPKVREPEEEQPPALVDKTLGTDIRNELDETGSLNDEELSLENEVLARDAGKARDNVESLMDAGLSPKSKVPSAGLEGKNACGNTTGGASNDAVIKAGGEFDESVSQMNIETADAVKEEIHGAAHAPAGGLSKETPTLHSDEALVIDDGDDYKRDETSDHNFHSSDSFGVSNPAAAPQSSKPSDTSTENSVMDEADDDHSVTDTTEGRNAILDSSLPRSSIEPSTDAVADTQRTGEKTETTTGEDNQRICNSCPRSEGMNYLELRPFQSESRGDESVAPFDETESANSRSVLSEYSSDLPYSSTGKDAEEVVSLPQISSAPVFPSDDSSRCNDVVQEMKSSEKRLEVDCEVPSQHFDEEKEGKDSINFDSEVSPSVVFKEEENRESESEGTSQYLEPVLANKDSERAIYDSDQSSQHPDFSSPSMEENKCRKIELTTVFDTESPTGSHSNVSNNPYRSETSELECLEPEDNQFSGSVAKVSIANTSMEDSPSKQLPDLQNVDDEQEECDDAKESPGFHSVLVGRIADTRMEVNASGFNQESNTVDDEDDDEQSPFLESSANNSAAEAFAEVNDNERSEQLEPNGRLAVDSLQDKILDSSASAAREPDTPESATLCDKDNSYDVLAAKDKAESHMDTHTAAESEDNKSSVDFVAGGNKQSIAAMEISVSEEESCHSTDAAVDVYDNVVDEEPYPISEQDGHFVAESDGKSASYGESNYFNKAEACLPNAEDDIHSAEMPPVAASVDLSASNSLEIYLANPLDENDEHALQNHTSDSGGVAKSSAEVGSENYGAASPSVSLRGSFPPGSSFNDPDVSKLEQDCAIDPILSSDGSVHDESDGYEVNIENHNADVSNQNGSYRNESSPNIAAGKSRTDQASSLGISNEDDTVLQQQEPTGSVTHEQYREGSCNQGEAGHEEVEVPFISAKDDTCVDQKKEIQRFMGESLNMQERIRALQEIVSGAGLPDEDTLPEESLGDENSSAQPEVTACYSADQSDQSDQSATSAGASAWSDTDDESFINRVLRATSGQESARPSGEMEAGNTDTNATVTNGAGLLSNCSTFKSEGDKNSDSSSKADRDEPITEAHNHEIETSELWDEVVNEAEERKVLSVSCETEEHSVHPSEVEGNTPETPEIKESSLDVAQVSPNLSPVSANFGVADSADHEPSPEKPAPDPARYSHDFFSDSAFLVADASFRQKVTTESIRVERVHRNPIDEHQASPLHITEGEGQWNENPDTSVEPSPRRKMMPQQALVEDDDTDNEVEELLQDLVDFKLRVRRPNASDESEGAPEEECPETEDRLIASTETGSLEQSGSQHISVNQGRTPFEEELLRLKAELSSKRGQNDSSAVGLQRALSTPKLNTAKRALNDSNDSSKDTSNDDSERVRELLKQAFKSKRTGSHEHLKAQAKRSYSYSYGDNLGSVDGENVKPLGNYDLQSNPDDSSPNGGSVNQSCSSREDNSVSRAKLQPSGSKMDPAEDEPAESRSLHQWHAEDESIEKNDSDIAALSAQPTPVRGGDPDGAASVSSLKKEPPERPHLLDGMQPTRFRSRLASTPDAVYAQLVKKAALLAQLQRLSNPADHLLSVETRIRKYEGFFEGESIPSAIEGTEGSPHYHNQNDHNFTGEEYGNDDDSESLSLVYSIDASISLSSTIKTEDTHYNHYLAGPSNHANDSRNNATREIGHSAADHNLGTINESFASEKLNEREEEELPAADVTQVKQNGSGADVVVETVDDEENDRSSGCLDEATAATAVTMFKPSNSVSETPRSPGAQNQNGPSKSTAQVVGSEYDYANTLNLSSCMNESLDFDDNSILESKAPLPKETAPIVSAPVTTSKGIVALGTPIKDEAIPVEAALTGIRELVAETFPGFPSLHALFDENTSPPQLEEDPTDDNNTSSYSNPEFFSVECTLSVYGNHNDEQSENSGTQSFGGDAGNHFPTSTGQQQREAVSLLKPVQEQGQTNVERSRRKSESNVSCAEKASLVARMQTKEPGMPAATPRSTSRLLASGDFPLDTFEFKTKKSKKTKGSDNDSSQSSVQDPSVFSSAYLPPRPDHLDGDDYDYNYDYQDDYYTI